MSRLRSLTTAIAVLVLAAPLGARLGAQSAPQAAAAQDSVAPVAAVQNSAPVAPAPIAVRASASVNAPLAAPAPVATSRNVALMVVGGAALIVGAIIGGRTGTIVMVGGGVIGLIGLWNYLQ